MKNNVLVHEVIPPAEYGMDDSKHLFNLDVFVSVLMQAFGRVPLVAKMASQTFYASGVSVDVQDFVCG